MSFEIHSDIAEHPKFAKLSLAAFGLWAQAGSWTSAHDSPGFVPAGAVADLGDDEDVTPYVAELVKAGVWTAVAEGYQMEFGPSTDWPLPLWRYTP